MDSVPSDPAQRSRGLPVAVKILVAGGCGAGEKNQVRSVDYCERRGTPFIVAVNCFEGASWYEPDEVRLALDLDPHVPLLLCDARRRESSKQALIALVEHVMELSAGHREAVEVQA